MKKPQLPLILVLGIPSVLLSSCGMSLSREGTETLLGKIVDYVSSSSFSAPKSWTIEMSGKGKITQESVTYEGSFSSAHHYSTSDCYYHSTVSIDGKVGAPLTIKYASDEWIYVDLMNVSGAKVYVLIHALANGLDESKTYSFSDYATSEEAAKAFNSDATVIQEQTRLQDLSEVPSSLKNQLSSLDNSAIESETYSTSGELSLIASLTYKDQGVSTSEKIKIDEGFLESVVQSNDDLSLSTSYNWNLFKTSKPDLSTYTRESSLSK